MSWNAAKRALEYGFSNVSWYPGGSDGWAKAGLPLEDGRAAAVSGQASASASFEAR